MRVVEVIPIVRGLPRPTLTYFSKDKFEIGSFVRIPLRKGSAMGLVASSKEARSVKSSVKRASYPLRKLSSVERAGRLSAAFMSAVASTAEFYATTWGNVLGAVLPKFLLEHPELLQRIAKTGLGAAHEVKLVQLNFEERFREYRGIVRENFARGLSVMFVAPTREDALRAHELLSVGIEPYVYTAVQKSPKLLKKLIMEARDNRHPILFITTSSWLSFDRPDLCTYILEKENSRAYRTLSRPYINFRYFLEKYVGAKRGTLVLGDSVLSMESLWNEREGKYSEFAPLTWRLNTGSTSGVVDMRAQKEFKVFSEELKMVIASTIARGQNVFIFAARKGMSPTTICVDCGALLLCKNCGAPLVLHKLSVLENGVYVCHHCGAKRSAETRCDYCQSWKLSPLGLGIDRIAEETRRTFEAATVLVLDKDKAKTTTQAKAIAKKFKTSRGAILVGTELALSYVDGAELVASASVDSLFSIPDFGINERIFYLITRLREMAKGRFVLQTRNAGQEILEYASAGNILDFYRIEIHEREELSYPPFSIFIKVTKEDKPNEIDRVAAQLLDTFKEFEPNFMIDNRTEKRLRRLSMILRVPRFLWPSKELVQKLLLLTNDFVVKVDPESIL